MTLGQFVTRNLAFNWNYERLMEREAWKLHWLISAQVGKDAPTVNQILGREAPKPPEDPYGEVLKLIDPQGYREREWAREHMDS